MVQGILLKVVTQLVKKYPGFVKKPEGS